MEKDRIIVQAFSVHQIKEGKTYYMEFGFPPEDKEPVDMTICWATGPPSGTTTSGTGSTKLCASWTQLPGKVGREDEFFRRK